MTKVYREPWPSALDNSVALSLHQIFNDLSVFSVQKLSPFGDETVIL